MRPFEAFEYVYSCAKYSYITLWNRLEIHGNFNWQT